MYGNWGYLIEGPSSWQSVNEHMVGKQLATDVSMKQGVTSLLETPDSSFSMLAYKPWCHDVTNA